MDKGCFLNSEFKRKYKRNAVKPVMRRRITGFEQSNHCKKNKFQQKIENRPTNQEPFFKLIFSFHDIIVIKNTLIFVYSTFFIQKSGHILRVNTICIEDKVSPDLTASAMIKFAEDHSRNGLVILVSKTKGLKYIEPPTSV